MRHVPMSPTLSIFMNASPLRLVLDQLHETIIPRSQLKACLTVLIGVIEAGLGIEEHLNDVAVRLVGIAPREEDGNVQWRRAARAHSRVHTYTRL